MELLEPNEDEVLDFFREARARRRTEQEEAAKAKLLRSRRRVLVIVATAASLVAITVLRFIPEALAFHF